MQVKIYSSFVIVLLLCLVNFGKSETGLGDKVPSYIKDITINENEKQALDELRDRIAPLNSTYYLLKNDLFLIRWLRREYFNVDQAEASIKTHLRWREEKGVDQYKDQDWSDMERLIHYSLVPRDKDGKPVLYLNTALWNLREVTLSGKSERCMDFIAKCVEEGVDLIVSLGEKYGNVTQGHILMNLKGVNVVQNLCPRCIPLILHIVHLLNEHYVGWLQTSILVNVPEIAVPVITVGRAAFHPIIRSGIKVYGTNRNVWWKELTKYYDMSQIPQELGGNLLLDKDEENFGSNEHF